MPDQEPKIINIADALRSDDLRHRVLETIDEHPNNSFWVPFLRDLQASLTARIEAATEENPDA